MVFNSLHRLLALAVAISFAGHALAAPHRRSTPTAGQSINLVKSRPKRSLEEWGTWAKEHKQSLEVKYGGNSNQKRSASGTNFIVNQNADSSYYGQVAVGTPPSSFNVILDTGSADLWLADSKCTTGCADVATFNHTASETFRNLSTPFDITYGSGRAVGGLVADTVQFADFAVEDQVFAVCDQVSQGLLNKPVSGLLGLGWAPIAESGAVPIWQQLAGRGLWDEPVMAFHLTRFLNDSNAQEFEPGGSFTMGFANNSLYVGDIDYQPVPSNAVSYWILPLTNITVQGEVINIPSGAPSFSAIDTGTTLIGAPEEELATIFSKIPGAEPGKEDFEGYWTYPCNTSVNVELSFGGRSWGIDPADFRLTQLSEDRCLGAFFALTTEGDGPSWIIGDTFLKNVYTVFRYYPTSVGFAELSSEASLVNNDPIPSPTIVPVAASVRATTDSKAGTITSAGSLQVAVPRFLALGSVILGALCIL
ncbi:acid protease [Punctularia strigosozonata HHB-11173 SS5]|uniref:acid protease n=1 Tax=Punctularia strigosozonata (strain HHB-11173) TaxID=741275 RepID=UPI0004417ADF|nr:acid protease [Punctularia strigosozonata HHB-11173 SS5]EIN10592.1 acid protease [Punctularia strigosozonata HHB-11173 SS5]